MMRCGPAPDYDKTCWYGIKHSLELDFPNLPYYIDGDMKITQSNAILRHIARKHDMLGKTEEERVRVDIMGEQSMDFRHGISETVQILHLTWAFLKGWEERRWFSNFCSSLNYPRTSDAESGQFQIFHALRNGMVRLAYNPNFDQMKGPYLEALPEKLEAFQG